MIVIQVDQQGERGEEQAADRDAGEGVVRTAEGVAGGLGGDGVDFQIEAVNQMRGRDGLRDLRAKAAELGIQSRQKDGGRWKHLPMEVLRARLLDRLRGAVAGAAEHSFVSDTEAPGTQETVTASPLLLAIGDEDTGGIRRLCHGRADLNAQDEVDCLTPLFFASFCGHVAMARLLCGAKADVNASLQGAGRISGQTPLIVASIRGHTEVVQFLCDAGADKDQGDVAGRAPLFEAACAGHSSVVRHLLQTRAEIDKARDVDSMTPLHGACYSGHAAVVQCLCAAGADKFRQTSAARNRPVDLAGEMDHWKIVFWLAKEMHNEHEIREELSESG